MLNPSDYIITRKRKKYKFALFANSPICFEFDEYKERAAEADCLEIGAGTGLFSVELAKLHSTKSFLAVDVKGDRLQKGATLAMSDKVDNVNFLRARADQLIETIKPNSISQIWITFPDPFPKKRSAARRLTHPTFLNQYAKLLKPGGALLLKHDNRDFFCWSLEQLVSNRWNIDELSFDLHESNLSNEHKIITTYEKRWMSEGAKINFVKATLPEK